MTATVKLDYLRVTARDRSVLDELLNYFGLSCGELAVKGPGLYRYGWREDHAGAVLLGGGRDDMGYCLQLSGDVLARIGGRIRWALIYCKQGVCRASRIDLAGHGPVSALKSLVRVVRKSEVGAVCKAAVYARKWRVIANSDGSENVYIGSPKSDCFWRCYDKGIESKDPEYAGVARLEMQCEGEQAAKLAELIGSGIGTLGQIFAACADNAFKGAWLRAFCNKAGFAVKLTKKAVPVAGERLIKYVGRLRSVLGAFTDIAGERALVELAVNAERRWQHKAAVQEWRYEFGSTDSFVRC